METISEVRFISFHVRLMYVIENYIEICSVFRCQFIILD